MTAKTAMRLSNKARSVPDIPVVPSKGSLGHETKRKRKMEEMNF
jgi:hypothetical protein